MISFVVSFVISVASSVSCVYPIVNVSVPPWCTRATFAVGRCMRIPTSVVETVLLLAIPMIASFINVVSDSMTKRSPRMKILPVTSRFELIIVESDVFVMNVSSKSVRRPESRPA